MMKGMLFEEFSRAFSNRRYWLVGLLAVLSFGCGYMQMMNVQALDVQAGGRLGPVMTWQMILVHGRFGYFAALMAALPFADSLIADTKHHYLRQVLIRTRFRDYLFAKVLAVAASGMIAVLVPVLLLLLLCLLTTPAAQIPVPALSWGGMVTSSTDTILPTGVASHSLAAYTAVSLLLAACFGIFYSLLGLAVSSRVRNSFVVLGFPFLLYCAGSYILPASNRLSWLGSTEAALLPSVGLLSPIFQYLVFGGFSLAFLLFYARKERLLR